MMMNLPCLRGSCPNFLRPIYHTPSASQAPRRGHAPRKKTMPATALVCFYCYWPSFAAGTLFSGRLPCFISWSWCWCSALHTPSGLRVSFPKPCPDPDKLWIPARVWNCNAILSSTYAACGIAWFCLTMSPNSFFGSFLSNLPLVSNSCQVDAFNSALIASAFAIISCCSKIFTDKT